MVITDFLERNARLYGADTALVEVNPSEERDSAVTWREASLIAEAQPDAPYRRELSWRDFDRRANRFANFLLSRGVQRGTKVGILLMNCLEWLPIYFGILKAGCIAVPLNFRYASDEIAYCLDLADVEVLVFGPEFVSRLDPIQQSLTRVKIRLFVGRNVPAYAEDCLRLMGFCSSSAPPVALDEEDDAAIYFSSGTTGFPKAILHRHRALVCSCMTEQHHHGQTKDDVFLCIPPLYHTGAKMHWFGSLISGGKAVLLRGVKPEWILRTVTEEKCTIVWLLVPWAQDILDAIESGRVNLDHYLLEQWRLMHIGAQPVPPSLIKRWLKYFPDSQMDRFTIRLSIGYPEPADERNMVLARQGVNPLQTVNPVLSRQELIAMQDEAAAVYIKPELVDYIVSLIGATRQHPLILRGASPRATLSLTAMAKAVAYVQKRDYVVPKDIQVTFPQTIAHRLLLAPEADARQVGAQQILEEILRQVPAPRL